MAVILQRVVGSAHGAAILSGFFGRGALAQFLSDRAFDFGRWYCRGGAGIGPCGGGRREVPDVLPRYPQNLVQFSSVNDMLANSQSEFWAIDLKRECERWSASARELDNLRCASAEKRMGRCMRSGVDVFGG